MSYVFNFGLPGLYKGLGPALQTKLDEAGIVRRYRDGQHMQSRGDTTRGFSIVKSGAVCFGKTDEDGRFIAIATLDKGQCYGEFTLFAGLPRTHDGYAVGETAVSHIPKARFDLLLEAEPMLGARIISSLTVQLHNLLEWADDLRRYPLKYRLGKALLQLEADSETSGEGCIAITQNQLADLMGVTRVAVAQVLASYKDQGFVATLYGGIKILDRAGLKLWLTQFVQIEPVVPIERQD